MQERLSFFNVVLIMGFLNVLRATSMRCQNNIYIFRWKILDTRKHWWMYYSSCIYFYLIFINWYLFYPIASSRIWFNFKNCSLFFETKLLDPSICSPAFYCIVWQKHGARAAQMESRGSRADIAGEFFSIYSMQRYLIKRTMRLIYQELWQCIPWFYYRYRLT